MSAKDFEATLELTPVDYDPFAGSDLARVIPTTEAQREIWLADQLGRDASLAYNESVSLRLNGRLDVPSLERALQMLQCRHEMLRATLSGDGMHMLISSETNLPVPQIDLRDLDAGAQVQALERLRTGAVESPFDLVNGPLFKASVVVLGNECFELILTAHHVVCDGWSFGVLVREMMRLYAGFAAGRAVNLPPADSFAEHALAQLDAGQQSAAEDDCRYWVALYDASVPVLELPADRPRPAQRSFQSRREDVLLDKPEVDKLKRYCAQQGTTLFSAMFAVFAGLMARLSAEREVVVGVPAAGQAAAGKNALVGHCVNVLPVRIDTDPDGSALELIHHARARVLDAYEHQSCTLGSVLKKLQIERDPSRLPLASVLFNLDSAIPGSELSLAGLQVDFHSNPRHYENFELFLNASQCANGTRLELQYNTALFDAATVRRWMNLYRTALQRLTETDGLTLAQAFLPANDDLAQLAAWNATGRAYDRQACIQDLIERQAAAAPWRTAISDAEQSLTYAQLDARANRLAHALRARAIGRGSLVGLCVERGCDMLVAQQAILKSGAAYVPLDPSYPAERLQFMADDAALALLVTQSGLAGVVPFPRERTLLLDGDAALLAAQPATAVPDDAYGARPEDAAYVIYTSGSTGKPKGVQVPHRAVVNFLSSMRQEPGIGAQDKLVAVTTLSFDIAVLELLLPLTVGAEVVLAGQDEVRDPHALAALLTRSRASLMQATPGTWRMLLDAGWQAPPGFKALIGGEALSAELAARLLPAVAELWNMYGPTETTVWSTCWRVRDAQAIRIGRPIANTSVWVLDEQRRPCPIGTPGEIWIGGDGVTLGYLNRAQLNAERYIDDPFSGTPGARLYRTGDRGRWCADGLLE
ncbi:MAG TPA: amino acid adenylation domain-containing protein, partial [Noviherbaspirillum sp.]|nr:amino acid adenylation domain-containing protein [Noviherbaspirillum sp.]